MILKKLLFYFYPFFSVQSECGTADVLDDINWGFCGPECAMHNETITWTKDVTFMLTVQYENTFLVNGLKLYGILLVGISITGLMIILVLAMGKIAVQQKFTIINININSSHDEYWQDSQDTKVLGMVLEWFRKNIDCESQ